MWFFHINMHIDGRQCNQLPYIDKREWVLAALRQYEARLVRYAARLLGDGEGARDVVQFAFLRLCEQEPEQLAGRMPAWLYTVCRNKALDHLRRDGGPNGSPRPPEEAAEMPSSEPDPAYRIEREDLHRQLWRCVDTLPDGQREAIELWTHGFSYKEISTITGRSQGNIRVLVHRGLARLREHPQVRNWLAEEDEDEPKSKHIDSPIAMKG